MNSCELTAVVSTIAVLLACNLSDNDLDIIAAILVQLGDSLATIAVQRTLNKQNNDNPLVLNRGSFL